MWGSGRARSGRRTCSPPAGDSSRQQAWQARARRAPGKRGEPKQELAETTAACAGQQNTPAKYCQESGHIKGALLRRSTCGMRASGSTHKEVEHAPYHGELVVRGGGPRHQLVALGSRARVSDRGVGAVCLLGRLDVEGSRGWRRRGRRRGDRGRCRGLWRRRGGLRRRPRRRRRWRAHIARGDAVGRRLSALGVLCAATSGHVAAVHRSGGRRRVHLARGDTVARGLSPRATVSPRASSVTAL